MATQPGTRTQNLKIRSLALYPLSQPGSDVYSEGNIGNMNQVDKWSMKQFPQLSSR